MSTKSGPRITRHRVAACLSLTATISLVLFQAHTGHARDVPFAAQSVISTAAGAARTAVAADVDSDGDVDVLSASLDDDKIAWYENDGASPPGWTPRTISTAADGAHSAIAADVDSDGDTDVLSASLNDDKIAWYENDGASPPGWTARTISTAADGAGSVFAADVDSDGDVDVLSASQYDDKIAWYENNGASPPGWTARTISTAADGAGSVFAADVDSDGDTDVLSASQNDDKIAWYENDGASPPGWTPRTISTAANGAWTVFAADVDSDGDMDALSASEIDDKIAWYENLTIHRSAVFPEQAVISTVPNGPRSVFAADVDSDGDLDPLSASANDDMIAWYENDGASPPGWTAWTISTAADQATSVSAVDVDSDGDVDVLSASELDDKIAWYENSGASPPGWTPRTISTAADGASSVFATDVDSDGDRDVLSASLHDDKIAWYENDGASPPGWTARTISTAADGAISIFATDVDGDGAVDVLSASQIDDKIAWYENDGASPPGWTARTITTAADLPMDVFAADVDSDGDVDVLSASLHDDKIAWYENDGASPPGWTPRTISVAANGAISVFAADVDADGDVDVLSTSAGDDKIAWYENDGASPPGWIPWTITTAASGAGSVFVADVDADGYLDVLSASFYDNKSTWYQNQGGQFALATTDTAAPTIADGQRDDVLKVEMTHRGRTGDTDVELATVDLRFEETAGDPLTTSEANALIENLHVYRDDGSGAFENGTDTLVTTVASLSLTVGRQTIALPDGSADVQAIFGTPKSYFVVPELAIDASSQSPVTFRLTHMTQSTSTAEDRDHDIPLSLEFVTNVASSVVSAGADSDGDGLADVFETGTGVYVSPTDTGTDPGNPDTDGDSFSDGFEVSVGTDPNDPDSHPPIVPTLGSGGAGLLVLALLLAGHRALRRR